MVNHSLEVAVAYFKVLSQLLLEELRKTTKQLRKVGFKVENRIWDLPNAKEC
jgi:hypothetical protein